MSSIQNLSIVFSLLFTMQLHAQQVMNIQIKGALPDTIDLHIQGDQAEINGQSIEDSPISVKFSSSLDDEQDKATMGIIARQNGKFVLIKECKPGPAFGAGLRRGDIIISVNGILVTTTSRLEELLASYSPGTIVTVKFVRRGKQLITDFYLGSKDQIVNSIRKANSSNILASNASISKTDLGMKLKESSTRQGFIVSELTQGGRADRSGIMVGDLITTINGVKINSLSDVKDILKDKSSIRVISFERNGNTYKTVVKP